MNTRVIHCLTADTVHEIAADINEMLRDGATLNLNGQRLYQQHGAARVRVYGNGTLNWSIKFLTSRKSHAGGFALLGSMLIVEVV